MNGFTTRAILAIVVAYRYVWFGDLELVSPMQLVDEKSHGNRLSRAQLANNHQLPATSAAVPADELGVGAQEFAGVVGSHLLQMDMRLVLAPQLSAAQPVQDCRVNISTQSQKLRG